MNDRSERQHPWSVARWALLAVLLVSAGLRFWALPRFPPGIEHDEVAEVLIAEGILGGRHALYFTEAYGQEPLFLYLVAGMRFLVGRNVLALRFVSASIGLLTVAAGARFAHRLISERAAVMAAAGIGVSLWPVFWSRVGLRGMLLPLTMALGADALWAVLRGHEPRRNAVLAGTWFGLSAYTYLAARGVPLLLLSLVALLWLFDRKRLRRCWRALLVALVLAALIAAPLVIHLLWNREVQTRVYEVDAPLQALKQGNVGPVLANIPRLAGMFTVRGDASERNNLPNRPVFAEPVWALLFVLGVGVALWRSTDVRYGFLLAWLAAMLSPSLVTIEAPNFVRTLGTLPVVMILLAVGAESLWHLVQRQRPGLAALPVAILAVAFLLNVGMTVRDYFVRWPQVPEVAFVWQGDLVAVAAWLDAAPAVTSVTVGGLSTSSMDASSLDLLMRREDVAVRWCDPGSPLGAGGGLVVPAEGGELVIPAVVPLSQDIADAIGTEYAAVPDERGAFVVYHLGHPATPERVLAEFEGQVALAGVHMPRADVQPGQLLALQSTWVSRGGDHTDLKAYVHLLGADGELRAQHDGLDCPAPYWLEGDVIVQMHTLQLPGDLPPGAYTVRVGLYDRQTLVPYPLLDGQSSYEVGMIEVADE